MKIYCGKELLFGNFNKKNLSINVEFQQNNNLQCSFDIFGQYLVRYMYLRKSKLKQSCDLVLRKTCCRWRCDKNIPIFPNFCKCPISIQWIDQYNRVGMDYTESSAFLRILKHRVNYNNIFHTVAPLVISGFRKRFKVFISYIF